MTRFDFYLLNLSFRAPEGLELDALKSSIMQLADDCEFIRENDETTYRHPSIYEEVLWQDYLVMDLMYNPELREILGNDPVDYLTLIIDRTKESNLDNDEIIQLLDHHSEELVNGLICLHEVPEVNNQYCVYNKNDWFTFHRHFLSTYPVSEDWFASRCSVYFPAVHFHQNISSTLRTLEGGNIHDFSKTIVHCLSCLNDNFRSCHIVNNIPATLKAFTSIVGFETSNEGNAKRREDLSFKFKNMDNSEESIYCEPHIKVSKSNHTGDGTYYFNRIYFHVGKSEIAKGKILVGHIGGHL